jgi:hypothetical protein
MQQAMQQMARSSQPPPPGRPSQQPPGMASAIGQPPAPPRPPGAGSNRPPAVPGAPVQSPALRVIGGGASPFALPNDEVPTLNDQEFDQLWRSR